MILSTVSFGDILSLKSVLVNHCLLAFYFVILCWVQWTVVSFCIVLSKDCSSHHFFAVFESLIGANIIKLSVDLLAQLLLLNTNAWIIITEISVIYKTADTFSVMRMFLYHPNWGRLMAETAKSPTTLMCKRTDDHCCKGFHQDGQLLSWGMNPRSPRWIFFIQWWQECLESGVPCDKVTAVSSPLTCCVLSMSLCDQLLCQTIRQLELQLFAISCVCVCVYVNIVSFFSLPTAMNELTVTLFNRLSIHTSPGCIISHVRARNICPQLAATISNRTSLV